MTVSRVGSYWSQNIGEVHDIPDFEAKALIARGHAELADEESDTAAPVAVLTEPKIRRRRKR